MPPGGEAGEEHPVADPGEEEVDRHAARADDEKPAWQIGCYTRPWARFDYRVALDAIAEALASAGAVVVGTATSEAGAQAISDRLGDKGRGIVLNIADDESVQAGLKDMQSEEGSPTILVNNAGITRDNLLMRMKMEEWDEVLTTNLSGAFRVSKACLRGMMKARGGRIISIASVVGSMGNAGQSNYAASKAGLHGLTKSVARELAGRDPLAAEPLLRRYLGRRILVELQRARRTCELAGLAPGIRSGFETWPLVPGGDLADREADRLHPRKRKRPIASGVISPGLARGYGVGLMVAAIVPTNMWRCLMCASS